MPAAPVWYLSLVGGSLRAAPDSRSHAPRHQVQPADTDIPSKRVVAWCCLGRRGKSACGSRFADCRHLHQVCLSILREVWLIGSNSEFTWWVLFSIKHSKGWWLCFQLLFKLFWAFLPLHSITFICLFQWGRLLCSPHLQMSERCSDDCMHQICPPLGRASLGEMLTGKCYLASTKVAITCPLEEEPLVKPPCLEPREGGEWRMDSEGEQKVN